MRKSAATPSENRSVHFQPPAGLIMFTDMSYEWYQLYITSQKLMIRTIATPVFPRQDQHATRHGFLFLGPRLVMSVIAQDFTGQGNDPESATIRTGSPLKLWRANITFSLRTSSAGLSDILGSRYKVCSKCIWTFVEVCDLHKMGRLFFKFLTYLCFFKSLLLLFVIHLLHFPSRSLPVDVCFCV